MERTDRELFNMEHCRQELLDSWKQGLLSSLLLFLAPGLLVLLIMIIVGALWQSSSVIRYVVLGLLGLIPVSLLVLVAVINIDGWRQIKNMPFIMVEDTLTKAEEIATEAKRHRKYRHFTDPIIVYHWEFHFSEHGLYSTSGEEHAPWSSTYRMRSKTLMHASDAGDKFYLLLDETQSGEDREKKRIVRIYSQKYFQWQGKIDKSE